MPIDNPVRFFDKKTRCAGRAARGVLPIAVTARHVLENLDRVRVPEKLPKKPHLLGMCTLVCTHVFAVETRIHRAGKQGFVFQQPRHLSLEIFLA